MKINRGTLSINSPAFEHGRRMPDDQSTNGKGTSPALAWTGVPDGTRSYALVAHDPDAPLIDGFTHWVLYNIPATVTSLPEGGGAEHTQGTNSRGAAGWTPAAPPPGHGTHCYYFHLYALDAELDLREGLSMAELLPTIDPHVINQARVVGTYSND
ncbi:YbhB/YbcL family Raf kinase inhibitor-like protein [Dactylosporangium sp. AC04546]|uniref:YbhB/YbcL family Raf kinase inhibitor-like protein n=1 Tax=Dactylosporangium sp. AC04546 TaxID=2862460 RepID=UPI001EDDEABF|nr:YbhB/YbcL family Raf kinase inhibitor-like protein [Dactylosporangium sp. AC04546]WVK79530.1 YbhB/YbcL family Raf kinase inhibitor-like protein [Dactylosporangium sp. AC04546]